MREGRRKVLVVDDDTDLRTLIALLIEGKGYEVETAEHGSDALRKLRNGFRPNIVILDLNMPVMDGWQFRQELLRDESLASIPVIVLSASSALEASATALRADGYVTKSGSMQRLCELLEKKLD